MNFHQNTASMVLIKNNNNQYDKIDLPQISSPLGKHQKQFSLMRKKSPIKNNNQMYRPIVINLQDTRYEVIQRVSEQLAWRIQYCSQGKPNWDIKWTDSFITCQTLSKMSSHQKINHFPGMITLFRKNNLAKNLKRMQDLSQQHYDFYPRTFLLPHDGGLLRSYINQYKKNNIKKTFIVKPEADCQGRGIYLTQNIQQIDTNEHCVVQKYISNPLLFKGLKFDLRIYVLIAGCDPLRIYIYNQGLVRFATQKYEFPNNQNLDNLYMHLTNYAINKNNPNYVYNQSTQNLSQGHKKSLAQFFRTLKSMGLKANYYWASIKDIIVKTLIAGQPHLQHQYRISQPNNLINNMCFEVLGFDFMIDGQHNCSLLEINHTPSFTTDTPLDDLIKYNLIKDTLTLMNISKKSRQIALDQAKQIQQKRVLTGKVNRLTPQQRAKKIQQLQIQRQEFQKQHLGSYQRIYPSKNPAKQAKYQELLKYSTDSYKQQSSGLKSSHRISPSKKATTTQFRLKRMATNQTIANIQSNNNTSNLINTSINNDSLSKLKPSRTPQMARTQSYTYDVSNFAKTNSFAPLSSGSVTQNSSPKANNNNNNSTSQIKRGKSLQNQINHQKQNSLLYQAKDMNKSTLANITSSAYQKCVSHLFSNANKNNSKIKIDMILPNNSYANNYTTNYSFTMFSKTSIKDAGSVPVKPVIK